MKYDSCECRSCNISYSTTDSQIFQDGNCSACGGKLFLRATDSKGRSQTLIRKKATDLDTRDLIALPGSNFDANHWVLNVEKKKNYVQVAIKNYRRMDYRHDDLLDCIVGI